MSDYYSYNLQWIDWNENRQLSGRWKSIEEKLNLKHNTTAEEVERALSGEFGPVYEERGERAIEFDGYVRRYYAMAEHKPIFAAIIVEPDGRGIVLSARRMTDDEKSFYESQT